MDSLVARLEAVTARLESVASKSAGGAAEDAGEIVEQYDQFMKGSLAKYVTLSAEIGGDANKHATLVQKAFQAQRDFMVVVSKHKTPTPDVLQKLLQTTSSAISEVQEFREKNRGSKLFNHLSSWSEGIPALAWVTVTKGANYVKETTGAADFYLNRVLKDFKEKDAKHVAWVKAIKAVFSELCDYIKEYHSSGLAWNPSGPPAPASVPAGPPAAPGGGGPPPPPPPAIQPPTGVVESAGKPNAASALFSQISKAGTGISSGLRKVKDDQKTHKNPNLRASSVVPDKSKPSKPAIPSKKPVVAAKKPPVFELQGKKWAVDYLENRRDLVIEGDMKQVVYMYSCKNSTLQVKGKINSITLDSCKKCAVVFDDAIATVEFVNCQSIQCQVNGKVPTVSVDKTDGCQVYLSKHSLATEIVTAKSSEMNILVPNADGDHDEFALPEQYKTMWSGKTFVTTPTSSHG